LIELVDFNEIYGKGKGEAKEATGKRTRRAGGRKKATAAEGAEAAPAKKAAKAADAKEEKNEEKGAE
jgi:large subunit ribosomal protein L17